MGEVRTFQQVGGDYSERKGNYAEVRAQTLKNERLFGGVRDKNNK